MTLASHVGTKMCSPRKKSAGKPAFHDLETLELCHCFHVECLSGGVQYSTLNQLEVWKAGLAPQRGCPAGDPALPPLFLRGRNTFYAKRDGLIPWGGFAGCVVVTVDALGDGP